MATENKNKGAAQGAAPASLEEAVVIIGTLTGQLDESKTVIRDLKDQLKVAKDAEGADTTKLKADNLDLTNQLNDSRSIIKDLKDQLKEAKEVTTSEVKQPTIKFDGVTYKVNHGAHGVGDALALSKNEKACREILAKKGQNALTKI